MPLHPGFNRWASCLLLLVLAISGCAHRAFQSPSVETVGLPDRIDLTDVPFYPQEAYQCGPAALATLLHWSGVPVDASQISTEIYAPGRKGSFQPLLISAVRHHDRLPYLVMDFRALLQEIAAGNPVLVLQNLRFWGEPLWHYAVVVGYDLKKRKVYLRSGKQFRKDSSFNLFHLSWKRGGGWGLVVLPYDKLPASVRKSAYLDAAADLEKVKKWKAAVAVYETASSRWPESLQAAMGLGISYYGLGNLAQSEKAFRRATALCDTCGDAFNNLSQVLADQNRLAEALDAVRKAIRLGGPNRQIYLETFREVMTLENESGLND